MAGEADAVGCVGVHFCRLTDQLGIGRFRVVAPRSVTGFAGIPAKPALLVRFHRRVRTLLELRCRCPRDMPGRFASRRTLPVCRLRPAVLRSAAWAWGGDGAPVCCGAPQVILVTSTAAAASPARRPKGRLAGRDLAGRGDEPEHVQSLSYLPACSFIDVEIRAGRRGTRRSSLQTSDPSAPLREPGRTRTGGKPCTPTWSPAPG